MKERLEAIEANRWHQNGDHPEDEYKKGVLTEGKLVRRYRTPSMDGMDTCEKCGFLMHDHGWIDEGGEGHVVCPGDWIITDVEGNHYPVRPAIFYDEYDELNSGTNWKRL